MRAEAAGPPEPRRVTLGSSQQCSKVGTWGGRFSLTCDLLGAAIGVLKAISFHTDAGAENV